MHEDVIVRMRDRIAQLQKVMDHAFDDRIKQIVQQVIDEAKAAIRELEKEAAQHDPGEAEPL